MRILIIVELAALTKAGVECLMFLRIVLFCFLLFRALFFLNVLDLNAVRVRKTQRQFIAVDHQFHRIAHRGQLDHSDLRAGKNPHIQEVLSKRAFSANLRNDGAASDCQFF